VAELKLASAMASEQRAAREIENERAREIGVLSALQIDQRREVASMHAHGTTTRRLATPRGAQLLRTVGHGLFV
jgi:hypothetical protein